MPIQDLGTYYKYTITTMSKDELHRKHLCFETVVVELPHY